MFCSIECKSIRKDRDIRQTRHLEAKRLRQNEPRYEISNNVVYVASKGSHQPAHTSSQVRAFASRLNNI